MRHRPELLERIEAVEAKCDRIIGMLEDMRSETEDSMLNCLKESARDLYLCSVEERRRVGITFNVIKHG
jgi:hypothetical protein